MAVIDELVQNNKAFASGFDKGDLPMPPARNVAVVTCMDARLHPAKFLGLDIGDAHVIRNAGDIDFLPFSDNPQSVREDVERIRQAPFIPAGTPVWGFIYDVRTGELEQVVGPDA